jgi:3-oxoacyl-(acyl-carrier-protein) synthase
MMGKVYIQAAEQISIQNPLSEAWMEQPVVYHEPFVKAVNPAFREYIAPNEARRMGNIMKRALVTSLKVLKETGIAHPDAIITGTSLGSLDYTEKFLKDLVENGEESLSPTYFMQTTHNTVSSTISIYTGAHSYNTTYSHGGISFELALKDAWMQFCLGRISNALIGGHDEMFESYFELLRKTGYVGVEGMVPCGECAMSMMLNTQSSPDNLCELAGVSVFRTKSAQNIRRQLEMLTEKAGISLEAIQTVMTGVNGNPENDRLYQPVLGELFPQAEHLQYKQLFGENFTVSALGLYAAAHLIKKQGTPVMLFVNCTMNGDCALVLLKGI